MFVCMRWGFSLVIFATFLSVSSGSERERAGDIDLSSGTLPPLNEPPNASIILDGMFKNYDKRIRPYYGKGPVQIYVSLGFLSISHVVEENMEYKGDIYMRQFWKDPRLAYGDNNWTLILQGEVVKNLWFPDTYIENSKKTTLHEGTKTIIVFGDGNVFYSVRVTVNAMNLMDFRNYPMDVQLFYFRVLSYGFDITQIGYKWIGASLYSADMAEFYVVNQTFHSDKVKYMIGWFEYLDVRFFVRRRFGHYVIRIFFPCILCTVVSWLPFWMDRYEIGDRGALGITTLLTEVFLLQYTNDAMPRVSYIKAADLFLIVSFAFTFLALLESVIVYNYKKRATESVQSKDDSTRGRCFFGRLIAPIKEASISDKAKNGVHTNTTALTEASISDKAKNGVHTNTTALTEFTDESDIPRVSSSKGESWGDQSSLSEKSNGPGCTASTISKLLTSWSASYKSHMAKNDMSFFVELFSRVLFPFAYMVFVIFFFVKYGV